MYFRITIPSLQDGKKDEAISLTKEIASSFFPSCKDGIVILKYTIYSPAPLNAMLIPYTKTGKRTTPPSMNTGTKAASGIKPNNAPI